MTSSIGELAPACDAAVADHTITDPKTGLIWLNRALGTAGISATAYFTSMSSDISEPNAGNVVTEPATNPDPGTIPDPDPEDEPDPLAPPPISAPLSQPVDELADFLAHNNPGATQKYALNTEKWRTIASRCLLFTSRIGLDESACRRQPIFISGADVPEPTIHDIQALGRWPLWVQENSADSAEKELAIPRRDWYANLKVCKAANEDGQDCDEFPLFGTEQGGPAAGSVR